MRLKVRNLGIIKSADIEFIPGLNLIIGSSGAGKSTLLRGIKNLVSNSFNDTSIRTGAEEMSLEIELQGHSVAYKRTTANTARKMRYIVDNVEYTKVGRTPLAEVTEALLLEPTIIDGESFYFNFSNQFASPFLIFESKSFIYSVLTYRNTYDISKIHDLYLTDIKEMKKDISTERAKSEILQDRLLFLQNKSTALSTVPTVYAAVQKVKSLRVAADTLSQLMQQRIDVAERAVVQSRLLERLGCTITSMQTLESLHKRITVLKTFVNLSQGCEETRVRLSTIRKSQDSFIVLGGIAEQVLLLKKMLKAVKDLYIHTQCSTSIHSLMTELETAMVLFTYTSKHAALRCINDTMNSIAAEIIVVDTELSTVTVCPLCGSHLEDK